jgi:hypothetical protein
VVRHVRPTPETLKDGYVALGKAARHQAETGQGMGPNPVAPPLRRHRPAGRPAPRSR